MAKLPEDITKNMKGLAERNKIDVKVLLEELKTEMSENEKIQAMPDSTDEEKEFKMRFAWATVMSRYLRGGTISCYISPLAYPRTRTFVSQGKERAIGNLCAMVKKIETDDSGNETLSDAEYGYGTFWDEASKPLEKLIPGKVYKASIKATYTSASINSIKFEGFELGGNDVSFTKVDDIEFPSKQDFYNSIFKEHETDLSISLGDMDINDSNNNPMNLRVITATVFDVDSGVNKNNEPFGRYTVTDDSLICDNEGESSVTLFVHPDEAIQERGSVIKLIGTVRYDKKNDIYRWTNHFIVETKIGQKRVIEKKQDTTESMDMDDLDAELAL